MPADRASHVHIVGAGFSGAVLARELAEAGHRATVVDARPHVAGNCHTERDADTGVLVHRYGPHIFHTGDAEVWDYVNRFGRFRPFRHRVQTTAQGAVYSLPINLLTINQFFGTTFRPEEARAFVAEQADRTITDPKSFEEQALAMVGPDLYEAFFKGYTEKQWGCSPRELPASILKRLPLRFSYDDSYFAHPWQGMPEDGYTAVVQAMLDHPGIGLRLNQPHAPGDTGPGDHLFWSGPLDAWFDHAHGRLGYRTLDFEDFTAQGDWQGTPVMNYGDADVPQTRITEHKHFAPWEEHAATICSRETSRDCGPDDIPYYPIRQVHEKAMLRDYVSLAEGVRGVTFMGRLGTYRYLDMDVCIREALDTARAYLDAHAAGRSLPPFLRSPL
ncbi:NAD(P)-binding protein [Jannaschia sp. S6380]|uniref:UDP-galactopyranose/dTDP-fucopyranose mutase family protein n=1 Tax=Jannaschia sp. S6380 TaxID=2926408 RepID=UPI001FF1EAFC|nr:UDP-galactopyranose mutase [Jannaschia sp. S6380]MCK0168319.1 NAD(P)-binding protein [Jannaschia sp. S6380]